MSRSVLRLTVVATVLVLAACGSDPVADEPELVGVATVRELAEEPDADIAAPEVSGTRTLRFAYTFLSCDAEPGRPTKVEATYTVDTVAVVVTPPPPDCGESEDPGEATQFLEVFLVEPVDDREVTGEVEQP